VEGRELVENLSFFWGARRRSALEVTARPLHLTIDLRTSIRECIGQNKGVY